jgi:hypothetical protein
MMRGERLDGESLRVRSRMRNSMNLRAGTMLHQHMIPKSPNSTSGLLGLDRVIYAEELLTTDSLA